MEQGRVVYLARYLPDLSAFYLRSVGPLAEAWRDATAVPGTREGELDSHGEPQADGGPGIRLLGADVDPDPLGRALYHVTLRWQAGASPDADLVVRLRLVDDTGHARWTSPGARPVNGLYPTNAWPPDVPIADYHEVSIPAWLPPGPYVLQVGLFPPFSDGKEAGAESSSPWQSLAQVEVDRRPEPEPLPRSRLIRLGDEAWLTGVDVPEQATGGAPLTVDLAWRDVQKDERVQLSWVDAAGERIEVGEAQPRSFALPAGMVRSRHTITAPIEAGRYQLHVGTNAGTAWCHWLAAPRRHCPLAKVHILDAMEGLVNFGDRVLVLAAKVGRREARPGDVIPVALRWRALRSLNVDYTVFVHLVGPDGRLHGQVDSWPVQGSHPTSQWSVEGEVVDPYEVRLDGDAPPGDYRVEVGLYELETMERLPVLNAEGRAVGDSFVVGTFRVRP